MQLLTDQADVALGPIHVYGSNSDSSPLPDIPQKIKPYRIPESRSQGGDEGCYFWMKVVKISML